MRMDQRLRGMIRIFRPELPLAAGVCVLLGEVVSLGGLPSVRQALAGFACGFFISSSALILNDYFDVEVDRINAPDRPIPSGAVSPSEAIFLTALSTALGLAAAWSAGVPAFLLSIVFWFIGFLYNWRLKQAGLWGNLMVSSSVAVTLILGGIIAGRLWSPLVWFFSSMIFLLDLGEEIAGDAMDMDGDRKRSSSSLAITLGRDPALRISAAIFMLLVAVSYMPALAGWLGWSYVVIISAANAVTLYATGRLLKSQAPAEGRRFMRWIYMTGFFAVLAILVDRIR